MKNEPLEPLDLLDEVTSEYSSVSEDDLHLSEIYRQRDLSDERQTMFDFDNNG